ncbi:hypothetical protein MRB53_042403 [Persea americana]|nr:hypothetical protein MRB53_042403 [Persea americana]
MMQEDDGHHAPHPDRHVRWQTAAGVAAASSCHSVHSHVTMQEHSQAMLCYVDGLICPRKHPMSALQPTERPTLQRTDRPTGQESNHVGASRAELRHGGPAVGGAGSDRVGNMSLQRSTVCRSAARGGPGWLHDDDGAPHAAGRGRQVERLAHLPHHPDTSLQAMPRHHWHGGGNAQERSARPDAPRLSLA